MDGAGNQYIELESPKHPNILKIPPRIGKLGLGRRERRGSRVVDFGVGDMSGNGSGLGDGDGASGGNGVSVGTGAAREARSFANARSEDSFDRIVIASDSIERDSAELISRESGSSREVDEELRGSGGVLVQTSEY